MGNALSTRWNGHTKKTRAEDCARITAREAQHIGAPTICEPVANSAARRLWCLCPDCEKRALYLYRPVGGAAWKCRTCHQLTDKKTQERATRAAFEEWLTPRRWARMAPKHPASERFEEETDADFRTNVAPFDWNELDQQQRAQLLKIYASEGVVSRLCADKRADWWTRLTARNNAAREEIRADIFKWWKHRTRQRKRRQDF